MTAAAEPRPGALSVDVTVAVGADDGDGGFTLEVAFEAAAGSTVAVVGPNGAGKSTLVSTIAGFLPARRGSIRIGDLAIDEPATGTFLEPERRPVAIVPQDGLLFPHLDVLANVAYGLRHRRRDLDRRRRDEMAMAALATLDLADLADRRPSALSGGQAQRAALARALVLEPAVLLLDEPLSNIDVDNRQLVRKVLQSERPADQIQVVITHGPDHANDADHLLVIEDGRVAARGTPSELRATPPTAWLAELLGGT
ncbi:MAG: ATP-binding cassette domain-containing protein [Actinomycetota bacterium]